MDVESLAQGGRTVSVDQNQERERSGCLYCLEGWVFLGSVGYDGEEVIESIRCRRCDGTSQIA